MKRTIISALAGAIILCGADVYAQSTIIRPQSQKNIHKPAYNARSTSKRTTPRQTTPSTETVYKKLADQYAWNSELSDGMILVSNGDKFGFVNRLGEETIPLIYDGGTDFEDGEAVVVVEDKYGVIDRSGEYILNVEYDYIHPASEGFYCVKKGDKWGYIDKHGIKLTQLDYDDAAPFVGGLGVVKSGTKYGAVDKAGNEIIPVIFEEIGVDDNEMPVEVKLHGRTAAIDSTQNINYSLLYDEISNFGKLGPKDIALVKINGSYGIINRKMQEVVEPRYQLIAPFRHGFARVNRNGRYNFITPEGKEISTKGFDDAYDFAGEYAIVTRGSNRGVVDGSGSFQAVAFEHGIGIVKKNGMLRIITFGGVPVNDLLYDEINPFVNDRAIIKRAGNYGFIDTDGYEAVKPLYSEVINFDGEVARVRMNGSWGLIDKSGQYLAPAVYDTIEPFIEDLARVERARRFGFIDRKGHEQVHADYDSISLFEESDLARTEKSGKFGLVDKMGRERVIATYDTIAPFSCGLYAVAIDEKAGYIFPDGKTAIKFKYDEAGPFVDGLAPVRKKDKWGVIDTEGHTVIPIKYDPIKDLHGPVITVVKNGEQTQYDRAGKKIKD